MDGPDDSNDRPSDANDQNKKRSDLIYAQQMRERTASLDEHRRRLSQITKPYQENAKQQITKALGTDEYGLLARAVGLRKVRDLQKGGGIISVIAALNESNLEQPQVDAVAEGVQKMAASEVFVKVGLFAGTIAATMPRWKKLPPWIQRNRALAPTWPFLLVLSWSIPVQLFVSPICSILNEQRGMGSIFRDPRFQGWETDVAKLGMRPPQQRLQMGNEGSEASTGSLLEKADWKKTPAPAWGSASASQSQDENTATWDKQGPASWSPAQSQGQDQSTASPSWGVQPAASWGSASQSPKQGQTPSDPWGSADSYDDASPVAPSYRAPQAETSGSAWDRLRQQAASQTPNQPRQAPTVAAPRDGWGNVQGSGGGFSDSRDSYSYPAADAGRRAAKDEAQREFDKLLEQERQGVDPETRRWR